MSRWFGTNTDIGELRQAQEALLRQSEWLRVTLSSIGDAVFATGTDGRIAFLNPVAAALTGWTEEQALGRPAQDVFRTINEDTREQAGDIVARVLREASHVTLANHTALVARDGREIPIEDSAAPILDAAGHVIGAVLVFHDVTGKRRAQQALRESEERYRALFETMSEGFALCEIVCDDAGKPSDYRHLAVNPAFERQTGIKTEHILAHTSLETLPGAEPIWLERYGRVALTGEPARFEAWFGPLGRWLEVSAFQTEPGRFGVVFSDVTARKRAEEERQRLAAELADRVGELQAILDAAPVAIWIAHDPQCLRITGNAYADKIVMQGPRGGNVSHGAPPDDKSVSYKVFRRGVELRSEELPNQIAAATGRPVTEDEQELVFPDGRRVHLLLGGMPLFDSAGRARGSVVAGLDVTQRRRAEEALRENEAVLRSFFDSAGVIRGIVDIVEGGIVHVACNAAAAEMFGIDRDSIAGKTAEQAGASEEVARQWVALYEKSRLTGQPVSMEYSRRDAAGRDRWMLATANYLGTGPLGHPRFAYTALDLTVASASRRHYARARSAFAWPKTVGASVLGMESGPKRSISRPNSSSCTVWRRGPSKRTRIGAGWYIPMTSRRSRPNGTRLSPNTSRLKWNSGSSTPPAKFAGCPARAALFTTMRAIPCGCSGSISTLPRASSRRNASARRVPLAKPGRQPPARRDLPIPRRCRGQAPRRFHQRRHRAAHRRARRPSSWPTPRTVYPQHSARGPRPAYKPP